MEQAASYRNDLQIACHATPIHESKNRRSGVCRMYSCSASRREDLGEFGHAKAIMLRNQTQQEITEVRDHSQNVRTLNAAALGQEALSDLVNERKTVRSEKSQ